MSEMAAYVDALRRTEKALAEQDKKLIEIKRLCQEAETAWNEGADMKVRELVRQIAEQAERTKL